MKIPIDVILSDLCGRRFGSQVKLDLLSVVGVEVRSKKVSDRYIELRISDTELVSLPIRSCTAKWIMSGERYGNQWVATRYVEEVRESCQSLSKESHISEEELFASIWKLMLRVLYNLPRDDNEDTA